MSKENHSNHLQNKGLDNFSKTGYSNSRLNRHTMYTPEPKLSFDAMTIVGNLNIGLLFFRFWITNLEDKKGGLLRPPP